jgi:hypothetical protein
MNQQLGLNNISQVNTHVSFICKNELPTHQFLKMAPRVRGKPIMTFSDKKAMFFCGKYPPLHLPESAIAQLLA